MRVLNMGIDRKALNSKSILFKLLLNQNSRNHKKAF